MNILPTAPFCWDTTGIHYRNRLLQTILTLFETGPHCRTYEAPQRTPQLPGLRSSWFLLAGVPYVIWNTSDCLKCVEEHKGTVLTRGQPFLKMWAQGETSDYTWHAEIMQNEWYGILKSDSLASSLVWSKSFLYEGQLLEEVLWRDELDNFGSLHILPSGYYWFRAQTIITVPW